MELDKCNIYVTPQTIVALAVMLLAVPINWLASWLMAAIVHELFHCIAVVICGKRIYGLYIHINGAKIQTQTLTYAQTAFCAFAGPLGGLLLTLVHRFPRLALCALVQSLYNLLPVYPLDGGRILDSIVKSFMGEHSAALICKTVTGIVICVLLGFCMLAAFELNTCLPLLIPLSVFVQSRRK